MSKITKEIMPFHLFQYEGKNYFIDIEKMQASADDEAISETLKGVSVEPREPKTPGFVPISSMALFVTQACNLRCVYCYEKKTDAKMEEKTAFQAVDWLFKQAGNIKKIHISFFGGEPFLNFPLMKKVASYAREKADALNKVVAFNVTTNATLLNDEIIEFIRDYDVRVLVSMDGPKDIQDQQRPFIDGQGSYDIILPRIKKLLAVKPKTRVHAVLVDSNKTKQIQNALHNIGFSEVSLLPVSASLFEATAQDKVEQASQPRKLDGLLLELNREADLWLKLVKTRDSKSLQTLRSKAQLTFGILALLHNKKKRYACGAGLKYIAVSCKGDIYLCHRFIDQDDYRLGNVFDNNLERQNYQQSPLSRVPTCAACFARYYCAGWCKHDNVTACGSVWTPSEEICLLKRRELELAAVIISQFTQEDRTFLNEYEIFPPKPCPLDF